MASRSGVLVEFKPPDTPRRRIRAERFGCRWRLVEEEFRLDEWRACDRRIVQSVRLR